MAYRLVGIKGPVKGRTFVVTKTETRIGRDPSNDLVIADEYVSRHHATIVQRGEQHLIINASPNGTLVNGKRVEQAALRPGDEMALGAATALRYDREVTSAVAEKPEAAAKLEARAAAPKPAAPAATAWWRRRPKLVIGFLAYFLVILALGVFLYIKSRQSEDQRARLHGATYLSKDQIEDDLARKLRRDFDQRQARAALRRAMDLFERRKVAPENLYLTIVAFKEAEAFQGGKTLESADGIRAYQTALNELTERVDKLLFEARALQKSERYNQARDKYVDIQRAVPDPESAIFKNCTDHLKALEPFIERPRWRTR
jgi:pSer/pThr/pTyr-binding forkhead associated (FHA) protein